MDDLISRQALCEYALNQKNKSVTPNDIMRFPSVKPERNGRWIHERVNSEYSVTGYFILRSCECSECGAICEQESNFCPNCGADMRGEKDDI